MRIAQIAPPWIPIPPQGYGGIELVVDILARGLHARGHDVTLVAPEGSTSPARVFSPLPATGSARMGDPWVDAYHAVAAYCRADDFDIVHDHTFFGTALAAVSRARPVPVHTLHGPWNQRARTYYELLHDRVHLIAISETQRRGNGAARYAATIPNGIDLDQYPLSDGEREDFLVYIGRANPDKAPELAVELAHKVGLPIKLVVKRAEPAEQDHWETHVAPRLGPDDEVLDEVSLEEKVALLQRGRAFVFPIRWQEPFGLVMIEALACGMPVLATPRGAATEIVEDGVTGFLRPDLESLAAALPDVDRISPAECRAQVARRFSADGMVDAYERVFTTLVAGRQRAGRRRRFSSSVQSASESLQSLVASVDRRFRVTRADIAPARSRVGMYLSGPAPSVIDRGVITQRDRRSR
jgi:glycosyltransferase involved in cell wall biosynthesis